MDYPRNQSSWGRAYQNTISAQKTARFMWGGEGVLAVAGGTWLAQVAPTGATTVEIVSRSVIGGLGGLLTAIFIIFFWNLFRAPYKQRNDARLALHKLAQTPLKVEYLSHGYQLAGKNWLGKNLYLRYFNVMLTNTSDTQSVSTKAISLEVRYKDQNGNIRGYALSLIPDVDKDKYGHVSSAQGILLGESEYLNHRDSRRGFYQFLDGESPSAPKLIQTWPTLVIVDSFDAPHRKEFSQSRFASQSNPDKEGSQTE